MPGKPFLKHRYFHSKKWRVLGGRGGQLGSRCGTWGATAYQCLPGQRPHRCPPRSPQRGPMKCRAQDPAPYRSRILQFCPARWGGEGNPEPQEIRPLAPRSQAASDLLTPGPVGGLDKAKTKAPREEPGAESETQAGQVCSQESDPRRGRWPPALSRPLVGLSFVAPPRKGAISIPGLRGLSASRHSKSPLSAFSQPAFIYFFKPPLKLQSCLLQETSPRIPGSLSPGFSPSHRTSKSSLGGFMSPQPLMCGQRLPLLTA